MNILITGATGYIGRRLKHRLASEKEASIRLFTKRDKSSYVKEGIEVFTGNIIDAVQKEK